jgi:hypothetical protein
VALCHRSFHRPHWSRLPLPDFSSTGCAGPFMKVVAQDFLT